MRRQGFSLLELVIVCVILGILLVLGYGMLVQYRIRTELNAATERLVAELGNAKGQAQAFGLSQARNAGALPSPLPGSVAQGTSQDALVGRIVEKTAGNVLKVTKQWYIGDANGHRRVEVRFQNLPALPMALTNNADQGLSLEIVRQPNTVLASFAFEPDGHVNLVNSTVAGAIYMAAGPNTSDPEFEISISPIGTVAKKKIR